MKNILFKRMTIIFAIVFSVLSVGADISFCEVYSSANYIIPVCTIGAGGGSGTSDHYRLNDAVAVTLVTGTSASDNYRNDSEIFEFAIIVDMNGDGAVDLHDAILVLQVVSGMVPSIANNGADANADGKIGLAESLYILQIMTGLR